MVAVNQSKTKTYIGNNLNLNLIGDSKKKYLIVGNECNVEIKENSASIQIVGDKCRLSVISGNGGVTYVGNNGIIDLGKGIHCDVVSYVGVNGVVSSESGQKTYNAKEGEKVKSCSVRLSNNVHINIKPRK